MYICIYRCIKFKLKMINYSKITKVHSKSYSRTNAKDVAVKRSCDNNKRHNETTMITSLSKSEQNVNHQHQCSCSKYLKYCYNTVKTKSNSNSHNGLKCSSSNTNISVNYRSRKCNDIKTNQSLNMSRHKYTKTTAITTGNKANNNSFIVDDVFTLTTTNANAHKHNNTITIKRKPFLTIHTTPTTTTTTAKKEEDVVHNKTTTTNTTTTNVNNSNNTFQSLINNLEYKLQYKFAQVKQNSKYSKYVILKSIFEELIQCHKTHEHLYHLTLLLSKLLNGFNEVITSYINENKTLKDKHEVLNNKCNLLSKDNVTLKTIVHKKENEITSLNKKLIAVTSVSTSTKTNNIIHHSNNSTDTNTHKHKQTTSQKIEGFNIHNVTDLDALYFYDKVNMNSEQCRGDNTNSGEDGNVEIPSLNLQFKYEDVDACNKLVVNDTKQKGVIVMKKKVHKTKKLSNTKSLGNISHVNMFK